MNLLHIFSKRAKEQQPQESQGGSGAGDAAIYSGMRVEVSTFEGELLFVAKLYGIQENQAELHQSSEIEIPQKEEALHVRIRGYNDHDRKAVHMEGIITPMPKHIWRVDEMIVVRTENERAFFRLTTNLDATVTMFSGLEMGEKPCKMLNISVGGAGISSEYRYHEGDKFLLKVRLLEDRPESVMYSQVLRVIEKDGQKFEYGCQFLELSEEDQKQIIQNIFAVQRRKRESY